MARQTGSPISGLAGYHRAMRARIVSRLIDWRDRAVQIRHDALPFMVVAMMAVILSSFTGGYWAYLGRVSLVEAQRRACQDALKDRRSDILVRATQAWSAQQVADDPKQSAKTRKARGIEAMQDRQSVSDRITRVDDATIATIIHDAPSDQIWRLIKRLDSGRRLDCKVEHPTPSLFS